MRDAFGICFYVMKHTNSGGCLNIIMGIDGNEFESWRSLHRRKEPDIRIKRLEMMKGITTLGSKSAKNLTELKSMLVEWESDCADWVRLEAKGPWKKPW